MKLYSNHHCPYSLRARITLEEKGLPYELIEEDLEDPSRELLRIHPEGRVPVLVSEGLVIPDSAVITEYLDEKFPKHPLMPKTPEERAKVRLWTAWGNDVMNPDVLRLQLQRNQLHEQEKEDLTVRICGHLGKLETEFSEHQYLINNHFTLADIEIFPTVYRLHRMEPAFSELKRFPSVMRWLGAMESRESFRKAMTHPSESPAAA